MEDVPVPDEIKCDDQVYDIDFHSKANVVAVGLIDGAVDIWSYGLEENKLLFKNSFHQKACRGVTFSGDGEMLFTISSDHSIQAVDGNGKQLVCYQKAHDQAINKLINISENILATGDDGGAVKLWDIRTPNGEIASWHQHEDVVTDFAYHQESNTLLSVGGDAMLCVYDLRDTKNIARSDDQESELYCVQVMKGGRKVLCGADDGVMLMFSWKKWGDCSDRYPSVSQTINCMLKIDESTVITGTENGEIKVVAIHPNKELGPIGDHGTASVDGLFRSHDRRVLGSYSNEDEIVRFWDISMFADDDGTEFDDDEESVDGADPHANAKMSSSSSAGKKGKIKADSMVMDDVSDDDDANWEDADSEDSDEDQEESAMVGDDDNDAAESEEEDSDGDDDSSSDDEIVGRKKLPTKAEKFFADL